ncbi:MAG TPA: ABC transporter substrate-binding protein [Bradyrhizobium sp.]|nr:ABC transporter substrate-binding protein [Bradyrhizobium sp.]
MAAEPPSQITIGTLYARSGPFAVSSQNQFHGLQSWADAANKDGGVMVKAFGRKIPVKIVSYDDQSSTATARTLYNQLITQDKVDVLMADFGSVLTSVAVPLAAEHHMLLIDPTGSSTTFFTKKTDYLADVSIRASSIWPIPLGEFLLHKNIKRVAILYDANDFDASQANTLKSVLVKRGVTPTYFNSVPTTESNYFVLLHTIAAQHPDAVIELGYLDNDIAFLRALSNSGLHFNMTFTIFPGQLRELLTKNVGEKVLNYTYTYPTPPEVKYTDVTYGPNTAQFIKDWKDSHSGETPNFLNAAGYNAGLIIQDMLGTASKFTQESFHHALMDISGKTTTVLGKFEINANGAQVGEFLPVAQLVPENNKNKIIVVYPETRATGKALYPAPTS